MMSQIFLRKSRTPNNINSCSYQLLNVEPCAIHSFISVIKGVGFSTLKGLNISKDGKKSLIIMSNHTGKKLGNSQGKVNKKYT